MIPDEIREAIRALQQQGRPLREISRALGVSRNTVRRVLRHKSPKPSREDPGQQAIVAVLPEIYLRCKGNGVRIREVLKDEYDIEVAYSTLTRLLRKQELREQKRRSGIYHFEPGQEMQHDTSPHRLELGGKQVSAQCASLVLAYSRMIFIQYYPAFTRFEAKAFLTEALRFFEGACRRCTIDNTHVVVAAGSGPDAIIAPEMVAFGALFGVTFIPHAIKHSDRKGRVERPFAYVENNFLAGRTFQDWADLNAQARSWCENTANATPKRKLGMTPKAAYVMEKAHLLPLPRRGQAAWCSREHHDDEVEVDIAEHGRRVSHLGAVGAHLHVSFGPVGGVADAGVVRADALDEVSAVRGEADEVGA